MKALIAAGYRAQVSPAGLAEYFTFQNILSDATLFDGVRMLPAGHSIRISEGGASARPTLYWDLAFEPDESVAPEEWAEGVRTAFERAVTRQLVSDVPIGSYLSGGLDSSSIALVASRAIPRLMTFTGGFDLESVTGFEAVFDERADAEAIARLGPTEHYTMVMHAGDMSWVMPELVWHLEDLRVGMAYQNHYIARLASKFVTVTLAGTGGDELFAGYPWRYGLVEDAHDPAEFERRHYEYWTRLVADADKPDFFSPETWETIRRGRPAQGVPRGHRPRRAPRPGHTRALLRGEDLPPRPPGRRGPRLDGEQSRSRGSRSSTTSSSSSPCGSPCASSTTPSPASASCARQCRASSRTTCLSRPKQGFSPPDQSWYRGPTMEYIRTMLLAPRTMSRGYFQAPGSSACWPSTPLVGRTTGS